MGTVSRPIHLYTADAPSDADLVARALDGDRWGREMLYRRHASWLLAMTTRLLANRSEAEEVVQDTFVTAFEQLPALREPPAFRAWLGQIAISLVRRRIRRRRLARLCGLDRGADDATLEALAAPGLGPDQVTELAIVDRVLGGLPAALRIAWGLRHVEGLELTEVAALCGCSLATTKRRIAAAEALVKQHVAGVADRERAS
jgi:RNA polymerase sigma-70 factor (ECF subfamily)